MVQAINLKKGMIFSQDGKLIKVLKANHHKPGKGNTVMQMDLRDVKSGAVVHKTMRPTEKVDLVEVTADQLGDDIKFLMPNIVVDMDFTDDNKIIGIELPSTVEMTVKETQPGIKGATVAGGGKPATMETGLVVQVPDFINEGEKLVIGTENGDYKSRANSQPR